MVRKVARNLHLLAARLLDGVDTVLLRGRNNALVVLAEEPRHWHVFVPGVRELVAEADGRVLDEVFVGDEGVFRRQRVEAVRDGEVLVRMVEPAILESVSQSVALPISTRDTYIIDRGVARGRVRPFKGRRSHLAKFRNKRGNVPDSHHAALLAFLFPLCLGHALQALARRSTAVRVGRHDDVFAFVGKLGEDGVDVLGIVVHGWERAGLLVRRLELHDLRVVSFCFDEIEQSGVMRGVDEGASYENQYGLC